MEKNYGNSVSDHSWQVNGNNNTVVHESIHKNYTTQVHSSNDGIADTIFIVVFFIITTFVYLKYKNLLQITNILLWIAFTILIFHSSINKEKINKYALFSALNMFIYLIVNAYQLWPAELITFLSPVNLENHISNFDILWKNPIVIGILVSIVMCTVAITSSFIIECGGLILYWYYSKKGSPKQDIVEKKMHRFLNAFYFLICTFFLMLIGLYIYSKVALII